MDPEASRHKAVQGAVSRLLAAVRTLRQHAGIERLGVAAVASAVAELVAVCATGPVELQIGRTAVALGPQTLATHAAGEVPFGALAACGVGCLRLPAGLQADEARRLLTVLAAGAGSPGESISWLAAFDHLGLPGLRLLAAEPSARAAQTQELASDHEAWWLLPPPGPCAQAFQPLRERAAKVDPAAAAADRLLETIASAAPATNAVAQAGVAILQRLLNRLCEQGATNHVAEILTRVSQNPAIPADQRILLWEQLRQRFAGPWLANQVQHADRWPGLLSLALQLDGEALSQLTAALGPQSLPPWLLALLPPQPARPAAPA